MHHKQECPRFSLKYLLKFNDQFQIPYPIIRSHYKRSLIIRFSSYFPSFEALILRFLSKLFSKKNLYGNIYLVILSRYIQTCIG